MCWQRQMADFFVAGAYTARSVKEITNLVQFFQCSDRTKLAIFDTEYINTKF